MNFSERQELERLLNAGQTLDPAFLAAKFRELAATTPSVGAEEAALGWRLLAEYIDKAPSDTLDISLKSIAFKRATRDTAAAVADALTEEGAIESAMFSKNRAVLGTVALDIAAGDVVHYRGPILAGLPTERIDLAAAFCESMKAAAKDPVGFASGFPN